MPVSHDGPNKSGAVGGLEAVLQDKLQSQGRHLPPPPWEGPHLHWATGTPSLSKCDRHSSLNP